MEILSDDASIREVWRLTLSVILRARRLTDFGQGKKYFAHRKLDTVPAWLRRKVFA
jgi:hypothetical protein